MRISPAFCSVLIRKIWFAAACAGFAIVLAGCGTSPFTPDTTASAPFTISGHAQGGNEPIVGGMVQLYATATTGVATHGVYVGTATLLGSATTASNGYFTITGATACSAPDMLYITVSGGNSWPRPAPAPRRPALPG